MKVILKGFIEVSDSDASAISKELPRHVELTLEEPGCITFSVVKDQSIRNRYSVYEAFIDQEAFDAHQQRVKSSRWGEVSKNVVRSYEITKE